MLKFSSMCVTAGVLCAAAAYWPATAAEVNVAAQKDLAPATSLNPFPTYWIQDRTTQDDFISPASGFGPVTAELGRPYVPNGEGKQQTHRVADLANPILQPWVIQQMAKTNAEVRAGRIPFIARERCWSTGVPGWLVFAHAAGMWVVQTEKEILFIQELDQQVRHVYMNVPHSQNPKPSWYGESIGHYEGDELVVDTIGMNNKSFVDNYRTPHSDKIHVVERFKLVDGGKTLQATATVEDPGAYNMAWTATQRWKLGPQRQILEQVCAENSQEFYEYSVVPIPQAAKADF